MKMGSFLVCGIFIFKIHLALLANSVGEISLICLKDSKITLVFMKQREVPLFCLTTLPTQEKGN